MISWRFSQQVRPKTWERTRSHAARAAAEEAAKSAAKRVHCRRLPSAARGLQRIREQVYGIYADQRDS
ncbi:MAG: hypothetical protein F4029_20315 [Gammaproteobacteria bacterium]|nr:hypothetical protein [Gammaproteobacteria bacterium]MYF30110.1 hypothetical protein [Gammaproteobacteria bacterium]MYK48559.1 hypothetical protein [Gammaproteobacteria bacterium]